MQITERTVTAAGQMLLIPDIEIEGWWTSLDQAHYPDAQIVALYRDHATAEQFHSEFKTDLDIERLPSGKFATNDLLMTLAAYSYNILRWIGLIGLLGDIAPVRHPAKRRRLKTVIQELITLAARLVAPDVADAALLPAVSGIRCLEATYARLAAGAGLATATGITAELSVGSRLAQRQESFENPDNTAKSNRNIHRK
jgi:hypothetical protein